MRAVAVYQYPVLIRAVVHVAGDMRALFDDEDLFAAFGEDSGACGPREAAAGDYTVVHIKTVLSK